MYFLKGPRELKLCQHPNLDPWS